MRSIPARCHHLFRLPNSKNAARDIPAIHGQALFVGGVCDTLDDEVAFRLVELVITTSFHQSRSKMLRHEFVRCRRLNQSASFDDTKVGNCTEHSDMMQVLFILCIVCPISSTTLWQVALANSCLPSPRLSLLLCDPIKLELAIMTGRRDPRVGGS